MGNHFEDPYRDGAVSFVHMLVHIVIREHGGLYASFSNRYYGSWGICRLNVTTLRVHVQYRDHVLTIIVAVERDRFNSVKVQYAESGASLTCMAPIISEFRSEGCFVPMALRKEI